MTRSRKITAEELVAELSKSSEHVERQHIEDLQNEQKEADWQATFQPYLTVIHQYGYEGGTIRELLENNAPLQSPVIGVLLKAAEEMRNPRHVEVVVRALAASGTTYDGTALTRIFSTTDDEALKWACINTIATSSPTNIEQWLAGLSEYWKSQFMGCRTNQRGKVISAADEASHHSLGNTVRPCASKGLD